MVGRPMIGSRRLSVSLVAAALLTSAPAGAQELPAAVRGLKVVVPDALGAKAHGVPQLSRGLRSVMSEGVGELIPAKDFEAAKKRLKIKPGETEPEVLAKAGREVGAQYIVHVEISKKGWLYTAKAILINVELGVAQMDFRSQYYKPAQEAGDRGQRVARRTLEKIDELLRDGRPPAVGAVAATPPPKPPERVDDDLKVDRGLGGQLAKTDPPKVAPKTEPPKAEPPRAEPPKAEPPRAEPPREADTSFARLDDDPPSARVEEPGRGRADLSATPGDGASASATFTPTRVEEARELLRISLTGGSGLLRTYSLGSPGLASSGLSYALDPLSLIAAEVELIAPGVPVALTLRGAFRPVRYDVEVRDQDTASPSGSLLDLSAFVGYHLGVAGSGRETVSVIPALGVRFGSASVATHPGDIVLSTSAVATLFGVGVRLPVNEVLELGFGLDGGPILAYSESPTTTGETTSGITAGGDLSARIWLSRGVAIAFDNRFTWERVSMDGRPTRRLPLSEAGQLENATITTRDLRTSVGVAFRL